MRVALFHDGDPRVPRLRGELEARGHQVLAVGPGASQRFLARLFDDERPDVIHGLGRGPVALVLATAWGLKLRGQGTRRAADVAGVPFVDGVIDGSLPGSCLEHAYLTLLGLR